MFNPRNACTCKVLMLALGFVLAFGIAAYGQETGSLTGVISDQTGAVIPSAKVAVTNQGTGVVSPASTNNDGLYRVGGLIPGLYSVKAEAKGFKTAVKSDAQVTVGVTNRVDLPMELGQALQIVTVEAGAPLINTEEGRLTTSISSTQVANLPLNGRNIYDLIKLSPGAVNVSGVMFENGAGAVVNGLRENFNGFVMDGVSNKGLSGGFVTQPNPDMVQEVQVNTLNMSAQYGNSAGSVTVLATKSGGNHFHGTLYEFNRIDKFDAADFFTNQANRNKNPLHFNQFGGSIGGPIRKDKTFFFASAQGARTVTSAAPQPVVVESAAWRNAVQTALPNSVAALLYSKFPAPSGPNIKGSGVADFAAADGDFPTLVCPDNLAGNFGGTTAQNASMATSFQALFGVLPAEAAGCTTPLTAGQTATQAANRLLPLQQSGVAIFGTQTIGNLYNGNEWSARIDHNISEKDRIFGMFYFQHFSDKFGPSNTSNLRGFKNQNSNDYPNLALTWSHTFGPTVLNELKGGYARNSTNIIVPPSQAGVPQIGFGTGEIGFGSYSGYPQFFHENIYTYSDMLSISHGKHAIKMGADLRRNLENSEFNVARSSYYFFDELFFAADAPAEQVAGVDPGIVSNRPAQLSTNNRAWRNWEFGGFVQDDWKVRPNLTVNLGMRYDVYQRHHEKFGRATQFILGSGSNITERMRNANAPGGGPGCATPAQIALAQIAGTCGAGGFAVAKSLGPGDHNNFGPRLGFAWDPFGKGKTSVRGGFGVAYEGTLYNPLSNSRWNLPYYSYNIADNFLFSGGSNVIYGPMTRDGNGNLIPSGAAPSFTGAATNPGQGVGAQAVGNLTGWDSTNSNLAFLTAVVDPGGLRDPYVYSFFYGVQHQLSNSLGFEVNYVGSTGHKLFRAQAVNRNSGGRLPIPGTCAPSYPNASKDPSVCSNLGPFNGTGRTNPNYGNVRVWENAVNSNYNSLQFTVTNKRSHGVAFNLNYTYGHSIDEGSDWHSGATSANGAAAGDGYNSDVAKPNLDRGNSTFDFRHALGFNYVWELPWMKSQQGLVGHVLGGWQLNGLWSMQTGAHWTPYDSRARSLKCSLGGSGQSASKATACLAGGGTIFNVGGDYNLDSVANDRPNALTANNINATKDQYANGYFGKSAVKAGFFGEPCLGCNGTLGRNTFVGPRSFTADMSLFKNFRIKENLSLQFRTEVFNALNRANFKLPSSSTGANFANRIQSTNFGQSAGAFDPREIQFALKLLF